MGEIRAWGSTVVRLLLAALVAGIVIPAVLVLPWNGTEFWDAEILSIAAVAGMFIAFVDQLLNLVVLGLARLAGVTSTRLRAILTAFPTVSAFVVTWPWAAGHVTLGDLVWCLTAVVLTAVFAWFALPWCLKPLVRLDAGPAEADLDEPAATRTDPAADPA